MAEPFETTVVGSMPKPPWLYRQEPLAAKGSDHHGGGADWLLSGQDLEDAQHAAVRAAMVRQQQAMVRERDLVTEGRDQGTEVFPNAECKFFLEASAEVRAVRRQEELLARGVEVPLKETLEQMRQRDHRDRTREISPLRPAEDAIVIDSSELTADGVLDRFEAHVRQYLEDLRGS